MVAFTQHELDLGVRKARPRPVPTHTVQVALGKGTATGEKWGLAPVTGCSWVAFGSLTAVAAIARGRTGRRWVVEGFWAGNSALPALRTARPRWVSAAGGVHVDACPVRPGTATDAEVDHVLGRLTAHGWSPGCWCVLTALGVQPD